MAKEIADEISLSYKKEKGYVKGVNAKSLPIHGVARGKDIQVGPRRGKVDITFAPLDDQIFYLGMDFPDKAKVIIVPHASTLFIMDNGQSYAIPIRREADKQRVFPALRFTERKEVGHLSALKRDEGPKGVMRPISPRKLARRKWDKTRMGHKSSKDQCVEQFYCNTSFQPSGKDMSYK